eukprot:7035164-Pyramimonas_sp.AAC.1
MVSGDAGEETPHAGHGALFPLLRAHARAAAGAAALRLRPRHRPLPLQGPHLAGVCCILCCTVSYCLLLVPLHTTPTAASSATASWHWCDATLCYTAPIPYAYLVYLIYKFYTLYIPCICCAAGADVHGGAAACDVCVGGRADVHGGAAAGDVRLRGRLLRAATHGQAAAAGGARHPLGAATGRPAACDVCADAEVPGVRCRHTPSRPPLDPS